MKNETYEKFQNTKKRILETIDKELDNYKPEAFKGNSLKIERINGLVQAYDTLRGKK